MVRSAPVKVEPYRYWESKLPIKHKKKAIFQSLRCLGEVRTSGLLNPIQKISFYILCGILLYFRISPDKCDDILNNHPYKGKLDHVLTTHQFLTGKRCLSSHLSR